MRVLNNQNSCKIYDGKITGYTMYVATFHATFRMKMFIKPIRKENNDSLLNNKRPKN